MRALLAVAITIGACAPATASSSQSPTLAAPSPSPTSSTAAKAYRAVTTLGDLMQLSPDGQTVISMVQPGKGAGPSFFVFQKLDGTVISRVDNLTAMNDPRWLADSSAVFLSLAAGQRAGPLGVLRPDGTMLETGLDDANPLLSPDGKWIAAERQEGCCVGIQIHEIRIAPRAGGPVRTLVTSTDPAPQPVSFLGWSPAGAVIYRDGAQIRSVTLDGRISELVEGSPMTRTAVSPDGQVILGCSAEPLRFWTIAGGIVAELRIGPAWPLSGPWCSRADQAMWIGGHELPLRDAGGALFAFDPTSGVTRPVALPTGATLVSTSGDVLLVAIDGDLHLLTGSSDRPVGLASRGLSVRPIDGGRFFGSDGRSGYLIG